MNPFYKAILLTTFVAGTVELLSAFLVQYLKTGKFAAKLIHYIAGGALVLETSMKGGSEMIFLDLLFHYVISFSFTLFFFLIFPKFSFFQQNK